jgi:hypothetical protein
MAAIVFPSAPSAGDIYTNNGFSWRWTGAIWETVRVSPQGALTAGTLNGGTSNASAGTFTVTTVEPVGLPSPYGNNNTFIMSNGNAWVLGDFSVLNERFNSLGVGTAASGVAGEIIATNNITVNFSDERLKTKTGDIENALDKVCQIETMLYHANETAVALGYDASIQEVGLTAQSVQKVQPEVVVPAPIDENYLTVRYEKLVPLLIEAIKELKAEIDNLKDR